MKVAMFLDKPDGRHERMICRFLCTRCGEPIEDLREANFAPPDELEDDFKKINRRRTLWSKPWRKPSLNARIFSAGVVLGSGIDFMHSS